MPQAQAGRDHLMLTRREAIKGIPGALLCAGAASAGETRQSSMISKPLRQLRDITPEELRELADWCNMDWNAFFDIEDMEEEAKGTSLHPEKYFNYCDHWLDDGPPAIIARYEELYSGPGGREVSDEDFIIQMGEVGMRWGMLHGAVETVRWFLDHGFDVWGGHAPTNQPRAQQKPESMSLEELLEWAAESDLYLDVRGAGIAMVFAASMGRITYSVVGDTLREALEAAYREVEPRGPANEGAQ